MHKSKIKKLRKTSLLKDAEYLVLLRKELAIQRQRMLEQFSRHVSAGDLLFDRWETAKFYGFGKGTSCYDNVLIIGDVKVGKNTWIGPNTILDGSGGLAIGSFVSISAGVQIYTHHTVAWSTSKGRKKIERKSTKICDGVYIGPNSIIQMGVTIGAGAVIGAMSFVNSDVPARSEAFGVPARVQSCHGSVLKPKLRKIAP